MSPEQQQLEAGIAALEAQRAVLGDVVVDASIAGLRARLAALAAAAEPRPGTARALRQVNILFLDVVGSTALARHLDPETVSAVLDGALARGTAVVEAHSGKVLQYAGDSILAAFGADASAEDDAERAVYCGLALLDLGQVLGAEVESAHGHAGFAFRVGIHTGGVLLGGGVDADGTIRGAAVNIAARMEQTAPAGALRISQDTYAQVRGLFEVEAQEPLMVKGVDAPVHSVLVLRAKPRSFRIRSRGIEGVATKMIGRDAAFEALQAALLQLFRERRLAVVTVAGDAGIGKSRLLYEFEAWSEARPEGFLLFRGSATPQTGAQAYGLLRDLFAWRLQINDDDSLEVARRKMEDGIVPLFVHDDGPDVAEAHAHLLGHLIGIEWKDSRHLSGILEDTRQIRQRALHAAAQFFRRIGASEGLPVVLQLEDLHWADDESLDFLEHLADVNRDVPLLMLAFTRPTLFERRTGWPGDMPNHQRIDLQALDQAMSLQLADELLKKLPQVPDTLRDLLTRSAEGNPFYMEELVKMLIDQGAIEAPLGGASWALHAERLRVTQVPPTLTGVLQARLDGLPRPEKLALQQASVVGTVFWDQALAAVEARAAEQLPALVRRELTLPRVDAAFDGLREYAFHHQLLHQVTYDTVLRRDKRSGHARVAQWLAGLSQQGSLRADDFLGLAAEHFELAGDEANAAEFHARAAEQAVLRFAHDRVLAHVGRALDLLGTMQPQQAGLRWRLLCARDVTLNLLARRAEQAADLDALAQLADLLDDDRKRAYVAWKRSARAMRIADWATQERTAREGMAFAAKAGDDNLRLHALRLLCSVLVQNGQVDLGRTLALQGLAEARSLQLRGAQGRLLNMLSIVAEMQDDLMGSLDYREQSLVVARETGDRINEAITMSNMGVGWLNLGDLDGAQRDLDAALQMLRSNGDRTMESLTLCHLSTLALWQGDEARALALARSALDSAIAAQARDMESVAGLRLGDAELNRGRLAAAREAYAQAQALAHKFDLPWQHDATAGLAQVALAAQHTAAARLALQPLLDHLAAGGTLVGSENPRKIELTGHQVLARGGDPRATDWLVRAHAALMAQADAITNSGWRRSFLQIIPWHREIVAAFAGQASEAGPAG